MNEHLEGQKEEIDFCGEKEVFLMGVTVVFSGSKISRWSALTLSSSPYLKIVVRDVLFWLFLLLLPVGWSV
jgi:hypothetical protein